MKRIIIALCMLALPLCMNAQGYRHVRLFPGATVIDTIQVHPPNYLCHDNPWYDASRFSGTNFERSLVATPSSRYQTFSAHRFITDEPIEIMGIAGAPIGYLDLRSDQRWLDTTIAGRLPEYFLLYESTPTDFIEKGEVRWDTCSRIRYLLFNDDTIDICEAYFDKPILVEDSFYVGFSMYNNPVNWNVYDEHDHQTYDYHDHLPTFLCGVTIMDLMLGRDTSVRPINNVERSLVPYYQYTRYGPVDSLWHYTIFNQYEWWLLWPIFDTTGMACQSVSQLAVTPIENQSTTLTWSAPSGQIIWDVEYGHSDAPRSSYTQMRVRNTPYLNLSSLDTGTYYTVFVRAMCDIGDYSNWSDSLVFYVPGDSSNVGIRAVEMYTNLFPNPASDQATVTSFFGINGVEVYSLKGELMEHSNRDGSTVATINIQRYPAGSYIVRIRTAKGIVARRLEVVR